MKKLMLRVAGVFSKELAEELNQFRMRQSNAPVRRSMAVMDS